MFPEKLFPVGTSILSLRTDILDAATEVRSQMWWGKLKKSSLDMRSTSRLSIGLLDQGAIRYIRLPTIQLQYSSSSATACSLWPFILLTLWALELDIVPELNVNTARNDTVLELICWGKYCNIIKDATHMMVFTENSGFQRNSAGIGFSLELAWPDSWHQIWHSHFSSGFGRYSFVTCIDKNPLGKQILS